MQPEPKTINSKPEATTSAFVLMALLAIIWGSSFILMKRGLNVYTPYQVGALRMVSAFITLLPFVFQNFRKIDKPKWKYLFASGMLGNCIPAMLFPLAETRLSGAVAGMLNSLTPVFVLIVGVSLFAMEVSRNKILGVFIGLIGALALILARDSASTENNYWYSIAIVIACICYALSVNILKHKLSSLSPLLTTAYALMFVGPPTAIYLFSTDFVHRTATADGAVMSISCTLILGVFGTAVSTFLFNKLIRISGALFASSVTYLIPIVATLWGFYDGESLSVIHLAGLSFILLGVWLINRRKVNG